MAAAAGGIVIGDLRLRESLHALSCISRSSPSEFLPSCSHLCLGRSRGSCSWRERSGTRAFVTVQLRETGNFSEGLLEGITQGLYSDKDNLGNGHTERSAHSSDGDGKGVPSLDIPFPSCDRSMSSYIQAIGTLQEKRLISNVADTLTIRSQVDNSLNVEERPAIKVGGRLSKRNIYTTRQQHRIVDSGKLNGYGRDQKTIKKDRYVSDSARDPKQKTDRKSVV